MNYLISTYCVSIIVIISRSTLVGLTILLLKYNIMVPHETPNFILYIYWDGEHFHWNWCRTRHPFDLQLRQVGWVFADVTQRLLTRILQYRVLVLKSSSKRALLLQAIPLYAFTYFDSIVKFAINLWNALKTFKLL